MGVEASDNPFKPPRADLEVPKDPGPMPQRVRIAVYLIWTTLVVGVLVNVAMWAGWVGRMPGPRPSVFMEAVNALIGFGIVAFLSWKVRRGRNWARWLFTVLTAVGVLGALVMVGFAAPVLKALPPIAWISGAVNTAIQVVAVLLLFTGEAPEWFRRSS
jgi:hypothetical protein